MKTNQQRKKRNRGLFIALGLGCIACLSATAGAILAVSLHEYKPLQKVALTSQEQQVFNNEKTVRGIAQLDRPVNIVVLGVKVLTSDLEEPPEVDLGYHAVVDSFEGVSDVILLLRFNPRQQKLTVLSIPRDTKTYIPGHGVAKVNAANEEGGAPLAAQAISDLLGGVKIDRYIRINVQGVEKLIDALGGVTVYVPQDMQYTDHSQRLYIDLKQGTQHLNGGQALDFIRFRHDSFGDIGRVQRQQLILRALTEKASNPEIVFKSPQIINIVQSHIDTNLTVDELIALSTFASQINRMNLEMVMLPGEFNGDGRTDISYWLPNYDSIEQLMAEHFDQGYARVEYEDPRNLKIAIQDSTQNPEAVAALVLRLRRAGYQQVYVSRDWGERLPATRIIAQTGNDASAIALRADLGLGEVLVESTGVFGSDITIILGRDWQQQLNQATLSKHNQ